MKFLNEIGPREADFIDAQHVFFVATAPLSADGHVNLSPKGYASFARLDANTVAYIDLGGSGIETHAHLRENGRICLMFCAFEGDPLILRLYGTGRGHQYELVIEGKTGSATQQHVYIFSLSLKKANTNTTPDEVKGDNKTGSEPGGIPGVDVPAPDAPVFDP